MAQLRAQVAGAALLGCLGALALPRDLSMLVVHMAADH